MRVRRALPSATLASILAAEVDEARRLGFQESSRATGAGSTDLQVTIPIGQLERECAALIVLAEGGAYLTNVTLRADEQTAVQLGERGQYRVIGHVQWCTWQPMQLSAVISAVGARPWGPTRTRWVILRAPWSRIGGPQVLTRGVFDDAALSAVLASLPDEALGAVDAGVPEGATRFAAPAVVPFGSALLVPSSAVTYAALVHASSADQALAVNPRARALEGSTFDLGAAATAQAISRHAVAPPPEHAAVYDLGGNRFFRILAVVDAVTLGAGCVDVVFTRHAPIALADVTRFDPATWHAEPVTSVEPRIARDHVCPIPTTPRIYLAPDTDQADYTVELYRPQAAPVAPDAGSAVPAPRRARRR